MVEQNFPRVGPFWDEYPTAATAIFIAVVLVIGLLLEDLGALIETFWDALLEKKKPGRRMDWQRYLGLKDAEKYVGHRYLRNTVTRMKFELSTSVAIIIGGFGVCILDLRSKHISMHCHLGCIMYPAVVLAVYLLWESYNSAKLAADTRSAVLQSADSGVSAGSEAADSNGPKEAGDST